MRNIVAAAIALCLSTATEASPVPSGRWWEGRFVPTSGKCSHGLLEAEDPTVIILPKEVQGYEMACKIGNVATSRSKLEKSIEMSCREAGDDDAHDVVLNVAYRSPGRVTMQWKTQFAFGAPIAPVTPYMRCGPGS